MMLTLPLAAAEHRLAEHYLGKLCAANRTLRSGRQSSAQYGLKTLDLEWAQIKQWQAWSADLGDPERLRLARDFVIEGYDVLLLRQTAQERADWLATALTAARRLGDTQAEGLILFRLVSESHNLSALDKAEAYAEQLFELARDSHDRLNLGRAFYAQGLVQAQHGLNAEAQSCYQQSLEIFEQLHDDQLVSEALWGLGTIANRLSQYEQGYDYFKRRLAIAEARGHISEICNALNSVATALVNMDEFAEAEVYARRCVALCRTLGYRQVLMAALFALGECALGLFHYNELLPSFEEALQIARGLGHQRAVCHSLYCLGYAHYRLGDYASALTCLAEALDLARQLAYPAILHEVLETLALVYLARKDRKRAEPTLCEALTLARQLDTERMKVRGLMGAAILWQLKGLPEQAAIWAGLVIDHTNYDEVLFDPVLAELEATLGAERCRTALAQGKRLGLDEVMAEVLGLLTTG